ncbi:unnamed protein product [Gulo gulo]|uniref:Uncharacterized protein n=1 Tax=Gulo gulo TaxID=48420 RepID=A0A9X9LSY6_GULGU|nr:unnamed protein product [Gulo gulo]
MRKGGNTLNVKKWAVSASTKRPTDAPSCLRNAEVGTNIAVASSIRPSVTLQGSMAASRLLTSAE